MRRCFGFVLALAMAACIGELRSHENPNDPLSKGGSAGASDGGAGSGTDGAGAGASGAGSKSGDAGGTSTGGGSTSTWKTTGPLDVEGIWRGSYQNSLIVEGTSWSDLDGRYVVTRLDNVKNIAVMRDLSTDRYKRVAMEAMESLRTADVGRWIDGCNGGAWMMYSRNRN